MSLLKPRARVSALLLAAIALGGCDFAAVRSLFSQLGINSDRIADPSREALGQDLPYVSAPCWSDSGVPEHIRINVLPHANADAPELYFDVRTSNLVWDDQRSSFSFTLVRVDNNGDEEVLWTGRSNPSSEFSNRRGHGGNDGAYYWTASMPTSGPECTRLAAAFPPVQEGWRGLPKCDVTLLLATECTVDGCGLAEMDVSLEVIGVQTNESLFEATVAKAAPNEGAPEPARFSELHVRLSPDHEQQTHIVAPNGVEARSACGMPVAFTHFRLCIGDEGEGGYDEDALRWCNESTKFALIELSREGVALPAQRAAQP